MFIGMKAEDSMIEYVQAPKNWSHNDKEKFQLKTVVDCEEKGEE